MSEAAIREAFVREGEWCAKLGAPFTARLRGRLSIVLDRSTAVGARVLDWPDDPYADALMVRLAAGLHALVRAGAVPLLAAQFPPRAPGDDAAFDTALAAALADNRLLAWLDSAPQTNEVARAAVLMPGMQVIAAATGLSLALFELGSSAGLNLRLDRYGYRLGSRTILPPDAPIVLSPEWDGPAPPDTVPVIVRRRGVDLAPIDLNDAAAHDRLLAFVWPEQIERLARLDAAIRAFVADPVAVDRAEAADWVEANIGLTEGVATTVFHSIASVYFPEATKTRIRRHLEHLGEQASTRAPLAWLRFEEDVPGAGAPPTLRLRLWPGGEDRLLAEAHPHGASVRWFG